MPSTYLQKVPSSVGSTTTGTFSFWAKIAGKTTQAIYTVNDGSAQFDIYIRNGSGQLDFYAYNGSSYTFRLHTNRLLRDHSAWYHIVCKIDLTNSTQSDRAILYINGVRETAFAVETYPSDASQTAIFSKNSTTTIGAAHSGSNDFDGCLSHFHFCDGYAYDASTFGSTDATTGEWKINTNPNVQYGTNGFFLFKDNASTTDQSGQGNNWSVTAGTLTKTEDNPSNNFATLNPVSFHEANFALSNGATVMATGNNTAWNNAICSTLVATGGKFYWEAKWTDGDSYSIIGIIKAEDIHRCATSLSGSGTDIYMHANAIQTDNGGGSPQKYSFVSSDGNISISAPPGCIMQFALDCENRKFWFGVNGTFYNSGNPATGANPTWDTTDIPADGEFVPYAQGYKISGATAFQFNFGNGFFGSTAISSEGTNASNLGKFEYDVPSGFTALCTKGLNE